MTSRLFKQFAVQRADGHIVSHVNIQPKSIDLHETIRAAFFLWRFAFFYGCQRILGTIFTKHVEKQGKLYSSDRMIKGIDVNKKRFHSIHRNCLAIQIGRK